ncbi:MAG: DUF2804 domain-containing protein [Spirochaetaceae bacterium]|jgi:hypothetical protein|nr:DUF2804 domain-containing protein [Spirochaetaceae bacterium]
MYAREIQAPIDSPIQGGKPVAGTWTRCFKRLDLIDIEKPYRLPVPKWLLDLRIKEWQSFMIQNEAVYFEIFIANLKFFRFIAATFYNKEAGGEPVHYFDYFPFSLWRLPATLSNSSVLCKAPGYSITVHDWLDAALIKLDINIEASGSLPAINARFEFYDEPKNCAPMAVNLLFSDDRSYYTYKSLCPVRGSLKIGGKDEYLFTLEDARGLFRDSKGILPYIVRNSWASGFGFDRAGRRVGFSMGENQARGANKDNENALWVDGALTPLPPVRITQSGDSIADEWIIEDIEGMVDLVFTPHKQTKRAAFNILISKAEFFNPIGVFTGFVMTKDNERIEIRKLFGCAERLYLRL